MAEYKKDCFFFDESTGKEILRACSMKENLYLQPENCDGCPYYINKAKATEIVKDVMAKMK